MPIYIFECKKCKNVYEDLTSYDENGKYPKVKCPKCNSKRKNKLPTHDFNVTFDNPKESSKWDSFSYRAGFNMEKAKGERRNAMEKSHMGASPYPNM